MEKKKVEILPDSKKFRILQLSNAVFCPSGYGVQSDGNLYEWLKYYDVRQLSNYGIQGKMIAINGLPIYPCFPGDDHGGRTAQLIINTGAWKPSVFITLYDIWMGAYVEGDSSRPSGLKPIHPFWIPIIMVDHDPIPEATLIQANEAYRIVTPTKFGANEFIRHGIDKVQHIPFGVNTSIFKPTSDRKADKKWLNERGIPFDMNASTSITEDSFVVLMNGANKDPYRKGFTRMFIALQIFLQNNPDAKKDLRIFVHSWMKQARDIPHGAKVLGIQQFCKGTSDYHNLCGVPSDAMARLYGAADVFMHLSEGGGFEIPILEALSCGVPVIGSDFVGMGELIRDHGWTVPMKTRYFTPLDACQGIADEFKAAEALEDAYNHQDKRESYGKAGREFALQFDWSIVNPIWIELFESIRRSWATLPIGERKL